MQEHSKDIALQAAFYNLQLMGFYKGMAFPLVSAGVLNSIFFSVNGTVMRGLCGWKYGDCDAKPAYSEVFVVAGFAGAVQAIPACSIELIKVKLQAQTSKLSPRYI